MEGSNEVSSQKNSSFVCVCMCARACVRTCPSVGDEPGCNPAVV